MPLLLVSNKQFLEHVSFSEFQTWVAEQVQILTFKEFSLALEISAHGRSHERMLEFQNDGAMH